MHVSHLCFCSHDYKCVRVCASMCIHSHTHIQACIIMHIKQGYMFLLWYGYMYRISNFAHVIIHVCVRRCVCVYIRTHIHARTHSQTLRTDISAKISASSSFNFDLPFRNNTFYKYSQACTPVCEVIRTHITWYALKSTNLHNIFVSLQV